MRQLHEKIRDHATVLVVHQREPHAGQMAFREVEQPATFEQRRALAVRARDELQIPATVLVDGMDDASRAVFGDLPSPAFVIDAQGVIRAKLAWADPERLAASVKDLATAAAAASRPAASRPQPGALEWIAAAKASRGTPHAGDALGRAAAAARQTWRADPARLVAALVELAELDDDPALWLEGRERPTSSAGGSNGAPGRRAGRARAGSAGRYPGHAAPPANGRPRALGDLGCA